MTLCTIKSYDDLNVNILKNSLKNCINKDTIFVCIGTDKFIFDSIGPITGTILKNHFPNLNVFGTLQTPLTALNLNDTYKEIKQQFPNNKILVIDAALSDQNPGNTIFYDEPAKPAFGSLGKFGHCKIIAYTSTKENFNPMLNDVRLYHVYSQSNLIAKSIIKVLEEC
jgi:putative sporulation protein YyaC